MIFARTRTVARLRGFFSTRQLFGLSAAQAVQTAKRPTIEDGKSWNGVANRVKPKDHERDVLSDEREIDLILKKFPTYIANNDAGKALTELTILSSRIIEFEQLKPQLATVLRSKISSGITPIVRYFYELEQLDSTWVAILSDCITNFVDRGYSMGFIELKSLIYFEKNLDAILRCIFEENNLRLSEQYLSSIARVASMDLKLPKAVLQTLHVVRDGLVQKILQTNPEAFNSKQDLARLLTAMLNSRSPGVAPSEAETKFVRALSLDILSQERLNPQVLPLITALSKTKALTPSQFNQADEAIAGTNSQNSDLQTDFANFILFISEADVIDWLAALQEVNHCMPRTNWIIMNKIQRPLCTNFRLMCQFLKGRSFAQSNITTIYLNKILALLFTDQRLMSLQNLETTIPFLRFASEVLDKLNESGDFSDFQFRDLLVKHFAKGFIQQTDVQPLLRSVASFIGTLNSNRINDGSELLKVIQYLHSWALKNPNPKDRPSCLLLIKVILKSEVPQPEQYIGPFVSEIIEGFSDELKSGFLFKQTKAMALINSAVIWLYRSQSQAGQERHPQLLQFVEDCHQLFAEASNRKVDLGLHVMHQYTLLCELCGIYKVYQHDPAKAQKTQLVADKLVQLLSRVEIRSSSISDKSNYLNRSSSNEDTFELILKKMQIPFEREKRIRIFDVDFYLPTTKTIIELNGVNHYTRSSKKMLINSRMKIDYLKKLGYHVFPIISIIKAKEEETIEILETSLKKILRKYENKAEAEAVPADSPPTPTDKPSTKKRNSPTKETAPPADEAAAPSKETPAQPEALQSPPTDQPLASEPAPPKKKPTRKKNASEEPTSQ